MKRNSEARPCGRPPKRSHVDLQEKDESVRGKPLPYCAAFLIVLVAAAMIFGACRGDDANSQTNGNAATSSSPRRPQPQTEFERDLEYVRLGHFTYIYVIARPDGAVLSSDDINYLTENTPKETNQRVSTEGKRRVIVGTNFVFTPENLDALRKRFTVEDYSGR
ncbi:MAG TPA: hypothetical protein VF708_15130 [Pyrinomonadaceae bacterium]